MTARFALFARRTTLLAASLALLSACGGGGGSDSAPATDPNAAFGWANVTALATTDTAVGTGAVAEAGKQATVTYSGYLYDARVADKRGTRFDTNVGGNPFRFQLGAGTVIRGFDQGVTGMKVGGKRTVTIPASLAYGSTGAGTAIPPNAALVFDIELTAVN